MLPASESRQMLRAFGCSVRLKKEESSREKNRKEGRKTTDQERNMQKSEREAQMGQRTGRMRLKKLQMSITTQG